MRREFFRHSRDGLVKILPKGKTASVCAFIFLLMSAVCVKIN